MTMSNRKPRYTKRHQSDNVRLIRYLQSKCVVCLDLPNEHPSRPLGCCGKYVHESCLYQCFKHCRDKIQTKCPHCRQTIFPYNCDDGLTLVPPTGCFPFAFRFIKVAHLRSREELTAEELEDWYLRGPPIPSAPVGWAAYRQQWRRS